MHKQWGKKTNILKSGGFCVFLCLENTNYVDEIVAKKHGSWEIYYTENKVTLFFPIRNKL